MVVKQFSQAATAKHGSLANRIGAILTAGAAGDKLAFTDEGEAPVGGSRTVLLAAASIPSIARGDDQAAITLSYSDPMDEATLGAAVACATEPGMPIAVDPESLSILALADRLAGSDIPVLITGPTGTGKEVLSRFIHDRSSRHKGPFIAINCAAMPETMLEAMLFGHEKGSFTGASAAGEGFFRAAHGGTLLLDEIAEMPLALQAKLLRALQEGEVVPIGATRPVKVDVRIVACANRDLPSEVEDGRFRADLYYRLNVFPLALSALRERPQDIAAIAFAMILRHSKGQPAPWLGGEALAMLKAHSWPGNIRELENVIRRALLLANGAEMIAPQHIVFDQAARMASESAPAVADGGKLSNIVQISEARAIMATLEACGGHRANAARELGISERTLRYRLASFRDAGIAVGGRQ
jgi:two-component system response regulator FlrC